MTIFAVIGNAVRAATFVGLAFHLGGCALSPFDEDSVLRQAGTQIGTTGKLADPKPFVRDSRPAEQSYPPVGVTPAPHSIPPRPASGVQALEAELTALRQRNEQAVAAPRPASPFDGKVEPGFKPPPPAPLPAYTGPKIDVPAPANAPAVANPPAPAKKSTARKPNDKKSGAGSDKPKT